MKSLKLTIVIFASISILILLVFSLNNKSSRVVETQINIDSQTKYFSNQSFDNITANNRGEIFKPSIGQLSLLIPANWKMEDLSTRELREETCQLASCLRNEVNYLNSDNSLRLNISVLNALAKEGDGGGALLKENEYQDYSFMGRGGINIAVPILKNDNQWIQIDNETFICNALGVIRDLEASDDYPYAIDFAIRIREQQVTLSMSICYNINNVPTYSELEELYSIIKSLKLN